MRKIKNKKFLLILILFFLFTACQSNSEDKEIIKIRVEEAEVNEVEEKEEVVETEEIHIVAVGDIMFHGGQLNHRFNFEEYDFFDNFEKVAPYIQSADFAIGNFETTSNPQREYASYPQFNTPPEAIDGIKRAGFDALATANNHCLDTYQDGIYSTLNEIRSRDLIAFGTRKPGEDRIVYTDVKGMKIALLAYTYGFNGLDVVLEDDEWEMVSPLEDERYIEDIKEAKKNSDLVIVFPHWGIEYDRNYNETQENIGRNMIDAGADLILGSHPHVVQGQEWIEKDDGKMAYIIYSMGNFLSGQRLEYNEDIHVEQSVLLDIYIEKTGDNIDISSVEITPLWVDQTGTLFRTLKAEDGLTLYRDEFNEDKLYRMERAIIDTEEILEVD